MPPPRPITTSRVLTILLVAQLVWGAARLPGKVWQRRLDEIDEYRELGAARFHLGGDERPSAAAIEHLLAVTGPEVAVLFDGDWDGPLEFAPALLAPRLLVDAGRCAPGQTEVQGRRLAVGALADGRHGTFVLQGHEDRIELTLR